MTWKILLAEDDRIAQHITSTLLRKAGHTVEIVANGKDAIFRVMETLPPFDAVLMDLEMPEMDGYTSASLIRKVRTAEELPIIALSARCDEPERTRALASGMNDAFTKPFNLPVILESLEKHLKNRPPRPPFPIELPAPTSSETPKITSEIALSPRPGIDLKEALLRMGGDHNLLKTMLEFFLKDHSHSHERLGFFLKSQDLDQLRRLAHILRGSSGTISATEVFRLSTELEEAILRGEAEPLLTPRLTHLDQALKTALNSVKEALG